MRASRNKYETRSFLLRNADIVDRLVTVLRNAPLDAETPLEVLIREPVKARKLSQNALMWVGPLKDIAAQAWVDGKQYSAEVWHEYFKREYLPEEFDPALCKEGYTKWQIGMKGERLLIGSTTDLLVKGFSDYIEQVHAYGASLGVRFHTNPKEERFSE